MLIILGAHVLLAHHVRVPLALLVLLVAPEEGDLILKAPYQDSRGESVFI